MTAAPDHGLSNENALRSRLARLDIATGPANLVSNMKGRRTDMGGKKATDRVYHSLLPSMSHRVSAGLTAH